MMHSCTVVSLSTCNLHLRWVTIERFAISKDALIKKWNKQVSTLMSILNELEVSKTASTGQHYAHYYTLPQWAISLRENLQLTTQRMKEWHKFAQWSSWLSDSYSSRLPVHGSTIKVADSAKSELINCVAVSIITPGGQILGLLFFFWLVTDLLKLLVDFLVKCL